MSIRRTAPRRRIERIKTVLDDSVNTTKTTIGLHTIDDTGTLIRILIDGTISNRQLLTGGCTMAWLIATYPGGTEVVSSGAGGAGGEVDVGLNELFGGSRSVNRVASDDLMHQVDWLRDVSIKRKLKKGDEIKLTFQQSNGNTAWYLSGWFYLWFKE